MTRLVGREEHRLELAGLVRHAQEGAGSVVLVTGEAGVGKTRLIAEAACGPGVAVLRGTASDGGGGASYGPLIGALRPALRADGEAQQHCGPLVGQLARLLPELGEPDPTADPPALFEALRCALAGLAARRPVVLVLDDLQWSDAATLDVLAALAGQLHELPVLVIGAYRSDGLSRDHGIRRLRQTLRRSGELNELALQPLDREASGQLLELALGERPSPSLAGAVHDRTEGLPFFVEETAAALRISGALRAGKDGLELADTDPVPLPENVRDAVLLGAAELSPAAREAAEVAAVAGDHAGLEGLAGLSSEEGLSELLERGMLREDGAGGAVFRHALAREALYGDLPWMRRRALHRTLAETLERAGGPVHEIARHWLGAHVADRARAALVRVAAEAEELHASRDAADAARCALELWPDGEDVDGRVRLVGRLARSSHMAGDLAQSARAWRELAALQDGRGRPLDVAVSHRELAAVLQLRGDRDGAFAARRAAAETFAASGRAGDAAAEYLAMANDRRLAARHGEAMGLAATARELATSAGRVDLRIRALGLEGLARAKYGDHAAGLETVRSGLALALEHDLTVVAAEVYQRLSVALYDGGDLPGAAEALTVALQLCRASPDAGTEVACVSCMAYVLRERGEWRQATTMCRELIADGTAVYVAEGLLGAMQAFQGRVGSARRLLSSSLTVAERLCHYNMTVDTNAALARVAAADGDHDDAARRCRALIARADQSDDHHYAVAGLRWATAYLAARDDRDGAHACAHALTRIAAETGHPDGLAALAHAIGETAMLEGDAETAADQLSRAVELHRGLDMPFERAQIELRAGVALAAVGEREPALERLSAAYRTARRLGARPLAAEAASEVAVLGESVVVRLGRRAAADADAAGLSRREREVVRLVAVGQTNREIAQSLFLSPRTVDMHVRNILRKLDCRSRVEAAGRARDLGLVG